MNMKSHKIKCGSFLYAKLYTKDIKNHNGLKTIKLKFEFNLYAKLNRKINN